MAVAKQVQADKGYPNGTWFFFRFDFQRKEGERLFIEERPGSLDGGPSQNVTEHSLEEFLSRWPPYPRENFDRVTRSLREMLDSEITIAEQTFEETIQPTTPTNGKPVSK